MTKTLVLLFLLSSPLFAQQEDNIDSNPTLVTDQFTNLDPNPVNRRPIIPIIENKNNAKISQIDTKETEVELPLNIGEQIVKCGETYSKYKVSLVQYPELLKHCSKACKAIKAASNNENYPLDACIIEKKLIACSSSLQSNDVKNNDVCHKALFGR